MRWRPIVVVLACSAVGCDAILGADFSGLSDRGAEAHDAADSSTATDDGGADTTVIDSAVANDVGEQDAGDDAAPLDAFDASLDAADVSIGTDAVDDGSSDVTDDAVDAADAGDAGDEASGDADDASDAGFTCVLNPTGYDAAIIQQCVDFHRSQGIEMITLTAYDDGSGGSMFATAFAKTTGKSDWEHDLTKTQLEGEIPTRDAAGYRPSQITGYGTPVRFAVLWIPKEGATIAEAGLTWDQLTGNYYARKDSTTLLSAETYWTGTEERYNAIWVDLGAKNQSVGLWQDTPLNTFYANTSSFGDLVNVAACHTPGCGDWYLGVFYFQPGLWINEFDMTLATARTTVNTNRVNGYQLRHISATGSGSSVLFAASWSKP